MTTASTIVPPVSAIADVLALWGRDGWLTPPLLPIVPASMPSVARVRTVMLRAGSAGAGLSPIYELLSAELAGHVVVVGGAGAVDGAVWGEILATAASGHGAGGILVDGAVRDRPAMAALGLPVYARSENVVGPNGRAHVVSLDSVVSIGRTAIEPADVVVMDATGCIRLRAAELDEVLGAAARYAAAEDEVLAALHAGRPLREAHLLKRDVVDELRR